LRVQTPGPFTRDNMQIFKSHILHLLEKKAVTDNIPGSDSRLIDEQNQYFNIVKMAILPKDSISYIYIYIYIYIYLYDAIPI
jgi:hypothetical protein